MKKGVIAILLMLMGTVDAYGAPIMATPNGAMLNLDYGYEMPIRNVTLTDAANAYWQRYGDVAADPYYGASPDRAWAHYVNHGQYEGRIWYATVEIVPTAATKVGGNAAYIFPSGGQIVQIDWQTVAKATNHEVIFILMLSPLGTALYEPGAIRVMKRHHIGATATNREGIVTMPEPVTIPAGWVLWLYCDGWGDGMVESQVTVRVK